MRATTPLAVESPSPDLARARVFAQAFGFTTVSQTADELVLRGTDAGGPAVIVRRGARSRYVGAAFRAAAASDLVRLADATGASVVPLPENIGGVVVDLHDPSGASVRVVADTDFTSRTGDPGREFASTSRSTSVDLPTPLGPDNTTNRSSENSPSTDRLDLTRQS